MSVVARTLRSTPVRSASETWKVTVFIFAPDEFSDAHQELMSVSGVASSLVASETMKDAAAVCAGNGPRVRVYCLYSEDAITGEDANEEPLQHCPTDDDWAVSLPCLREDLDWVNKALKEKSKRITARDMCERFGTTDEEKETSASSISQVDREAFLSS